MLTKPQADALMLLETWTGMFCLEWEALVRPATRKALLKRGHVKRDMGRMRYQMTVGGWRALIEWRETHGTD